MSKIHKPKYINRIKILVVVDVVGALAKETLESNIYLCDNNRRYGSLNEAKPTLKTKVKKGNIVQWDCMGLEIEVFSKIFNIVFAEEHLEYFEVIEDKDNTESSKRSPPTQFTYENTNITAWHLKVKKKLPKEGIPYRLELKLGTRGKTITMEGGSIPQLFS